MLPANLDNGRMRTQKLLIRPRIGPHPTFLLRNPEMKMVVSDIIALPRTPLLGSDSDVTFMVTVLTTQKTANAERFDGSSIYISPFG